MNQAEKILIQSVGEVGVPISHDATPTVFWVDALEAMEIYAFQKADEETVALKEQVRHLTDNSNYEKFHNEAEIGALKQEIELSKATYSGAIEIISDLRGQLKSAQSEIASLRSKLDDCKRRAITGQRI